MFDATQHRSTLGLAVNMLEVTFHSAARKVRKNHRNAMLAILLESGKSLLFVGFFFVMFTVLGQRGAAIRGDFMLYILTGVFAYLSHIQAIRQVMMAENATSPMMQHAPMNTIVAFLSAALAALYIQAMSLILILLVIHTFFNPVVIHYWPGLVLMLLLAWALGCVIGLLFAALRPWMPDVVNIVQLVYVRANMIFSGKMFVANMLPGMVLPYFTWNPLFHIIDQARGYTFVNYFPHHSNWQYPLFATLAFLFLAMMVDHYSRRNASASWDAAR